MFRFGHAFQLIPTNEGWQKDAVVVVHINTAQGPKEDCLTKSFFKDLTRKMLMICRISLPWTHIYTGRTSFTVIKIEC